MHGFSKRCHCGTRSVPFWSRGDLDEHAVAQVFCPHCVDRAPEEVLDVVVTGIQGWSGVYAIDWNQAYLAETDPAFRDTERYYRELFGSGQATFGFLPRIHADRAYTVLGLRRHPASAAAPPGKSHQVLDEAERTG